MDKLKTGDVLLTDRGLKQVEPYLNAKGIRLKRPPSVAQNSKLTKAEVEAYKKNCQLTHSHRKGHSTGTRILYVKTAFCVKCKYTFSNRGYSNYSLRLNKYTRLSHKIISISTFSSFCVFRLYEPINKTMQIKLFILF